MKRLRSFFTFSICLFGCTVGIAKQSSLHHLAPYISHEYLSNGLTYCMSQTNSPSSVVTIKLAVQFEEKWNNKRKQALSHIMEKLVLDAIEKAQEKEQRNGRISKNQIHTYQPQLFAVPNMTLYKWDIGKPTQTQIDSIFSFLSNALEELSEENENDIQVRLNNFLEEADFAEVRKKEPFFENDPDFYDYGITALGEIAPEITGSEVKKFYYENYKPKNMILFVQGNLSQLAISNSIKSHFSSLVAKEESPAQIYAMKEKTKVFERDFILDTDTSYELMTVAFQPKDPDSRWTFLEQEEKTVEALTYEDLALSDKEKKTIFKMIHNLSRSNVALLLWKKKDLDRWSHSVNPVHPLKFLATIISSPTLRSDLQEIRRNFFKWNLFMDNFRRRMTEEYYKENLNAFIEGFCEEIHVKEEVVKHFIERRDWEGLVKATLY